MTLRARNGLRGEPVFKEGQFDDEGVCVANEREEALAVIFGSGDERQESNATTKKPHGIPKGIPVHVC